MFSSLLDSIWRNRLVSAPVLIIALLLALPTACSRGGEGSRLVVLVVVDGLRAEALERNAGLFGAGGFRRLTEGGAWYTRAAFSYANTMTAVGHSTLVTGLPPSKHGIIDNRWFDRSQGKKLQAVADKRNLVIGELPGREWAGRSPLRLLAPTVGDLLVEASGGRSKSVAVAWKDRSAILTAGKRGEAWWFSRLSLHFTTSTYYRSTLPDWLAPLASPDAAEAYRGLDWSLFARPKLYRRAAADDRPQETGAYGLGRTFPHPVDGGKAFAWAMGATPFGDELTLEAARAVVKGEELGQRGVADLLVVGLATSDLTQHEFGPESFEMLDTLFRLDSQLAAFFTFLNKEVGADRLTLVLTADHGFTLSPETLQEAGRDGGRLSAEGLLSTLEKALSRRFGLERWVESVSGPYYYLSGDAFYNRGADAAEARRAGAEALEEIKGVHRVFVKEELEAAEPTDDELLTLARRSYHPERAGDLMLIREPGWIMKGKAGKPTALHGSPWESDRRVPLLLAGRGVKRGHFDRPVKMVDVAPTLAELLGLKAIEGAEGEPLAEALGASASSR